MNQRDRHIVREEIERLRGPLDRWDSAAIAAALGEEALVGDLYTGRVTAELEAAVIQARITRKVRLAEPPPPEPPRLLDVENVPVDGSTVDLSRLIESMPATEVARRAGVPRSTVQRIKAGQTRTSPKTAAAALGVFDESLARELENHLADLELAHLRYLAPVMEQIARDGPVRAWAANRQLLPKLRRRLPELDAEIMRQPTPDPTLLKKQQAIRTRIAELEADDDAVPPRDPVLERRARKILEGRRKGAPALARAGIIEDPGGDLPRAERTLAAFGLRDAGEVDSINAQRVYKLRARSRQR